MRLLLSTFLLVLVSQFVVAGTPQDSIGYVKQDGKSYVKYLVEQGETLYRISLKYGIRVSDLILAHPELQQGLQVGQVILIPRSTVTSHPSPEDRERVV